MRRARIESINSVIGGLQWVFATSTGTKIHGCPMSGASDEKWTPDALEDSNYMINSPYSQPLGVFTLAHANHLSAT